MMRPSLTRRQMLGGLGGVGVGSVVAGGAASQIPMEPIVTWKPSPGTWPYHRYDSGHTAANPHASPPEDPGIVWQTATPGVPWDMGIVVGPDRVYASGEQLTALSRRDGTIQWQRARSPGAQIIHEGTLYHGASPLMAVEAETGRPHWRSKGPHNASRFDSFTITADTVLAAGGGYDIHDGSHKWSVEQPNFAAQNGALYGYTGSHARVTKYRSRRVLDVVLGTGPTKVWQREHHLPWKRTVVQSNLIIQMSYLGGRLGGPGVGAFDTKRGDRVWTALSPSDFEPLVDFSIEKPDTYDVEIPTSAVTRDRGFMCATIEPPFADGNEFAGVIAVSLDDGAILWHRSLRQSFDQFFNDIVVANGTAILAYDDFDNDDDEKPHTGTVQALDAASGREQWRLTLESIPLQLAAVDETIFAKTQPPDYSKPPRIIALR